MSTNNYSVSISHSSINNVLKNKMKTEIQIKLNEVNSYCLNPQNSYSIFEKIINQFIDCIHIIYLDESFGKGKKLKNRIINNENIIGKTMVDKIENEIESELNRLNLNEYKNDFIIESIDYSVINVKNINK